MSLQIPEFYDFQEQTIPRCGKKFSKLNNSLELAKRQQKIKKKKRVIRIYPQTNLTTIEKDRFSSNSYSGESSDSIELPTHLEIKQEEIQHSHRDTNQRESLQSNRTQLVSNILLRQKMSTRTNLPTYSVRYKTSPHLPCIERNTPNQLNKSVKVQPFQNKRKIVEDDDSLGISVNYEDIIKRGFEKEKLSED